MTGLTRKQTIALTHWTPENITRLRRDGKLHPEKAGRMYLYDPVELYQVSDRVKEALDQLLTIASFTEGGRHFTEAYRRWMDLEDAGLIKVHRPVHEHTGIRFSHEYWTLELTEQGKAIVNELNELIEDGYFL